MIGKRPKDWSRYRFGGGSETNARSEYPAEFRPLATSAVQQIQAMQQSNPLAAYAAPNAAGTAGISPWQQQAMKAIPAMAHTAAPIDQLGKIVDPTMALARGAATAGDTTNAAQGGLGMLSKYGAPGADFRNSWDQSTSGRHARDTGMGPGMGPQNWEQATAFRGGNPFTATESTGMEAPILYQDPTSGAMTRTSPQSQFGSGVAPSMASILQILQGVLNPPQPGAAAAPAVPGVTGGVPPSSENGA